MGVLRAGRQPQPAYHGAGAAARRPRKDTRCLLTERAELRNDTGCLFRRGAIACAHNFSSNEDLMTYRTRAAAIPLLTLAGAVWLVSSAGIGAQQPSGGNVLSIMQAELQRNFG